MPAHALEINNLSKIYIGKRRQRVEALKSVSLSVSPGEVYGFLGPNGAGKSTTIKCVMGLVSPSAGCIRVMGEPVENVVSRTKIGFLPENPAFFDYLSAEEYLRFVARTFRMPDDDSSFRISEVLQHLDLADAGKRPIRSYSKGMVQRVGLAQALVHDPDVYILDEPMSGLDPIGRALVKEIILDLKRRGKTVFFSTHITDDVEKICDRVGVVVKGTLVAQDAVDTIVKKGIEGYVIQVRNHGNLDVLRGYDQVCVVESIVEFEVAAQQLNEFMAVVAQNGIEVVIVETKRKNLEAFFLDLVAKT